MVHSLMERKIIQLRNRHIEKRPALSSNGGKEMIGFWGTHVFRLDGNRLPILDGLRQSSELDVRQQETTESQNPLDVKGGDRPAGIRIRTKAEILGGGKDPMSEYNSWVRDLGKSFPLIVGVMPFGPERLILKSVSMEETEWGSAGNIREAALSLDFVEDAPVCTAAKDIKEEKSKNGPSKGEKKAKKGEYKFDVTKADLEEARKNQVKLGIKS